MTPELEPPRTLSAEEPPRWRGRFVLYAVGAATMLVGLRGLLTHASSTSPPHWLLIFAGGAVLHDGLWAPVVAVALLVGSRLVPTAYRAVVQGGVVVSGLLVLAVLPELLGYGRKADNPSVLPQAYGRHLLLTLGGVWLGVLLLVGWRRLHRPPFFAPDESAD